LPGGFAAGKNIGITGMYQVWEMCEQLSTELFEIYGKEPSR